MPERKMKMIVVSFVLVWLVGCGGLDPNKAAKTDERRFVKMIVNSLQVRLEIAEQEARGADEELEVDLYWKDRTSLLREIDGLRSGETRNHSSARLLLLQQHPENYIPERMQFLSKIGHEPTLPIPPGSYCRIIRRSNAKCAESPSQNSPFTMVEVTSGPATGAEGWICESDGLFRTVILP